MILLKNTQRSIKINIHALEKDIATVLRALKYSDYSLSVWITTNKTIHAYNKKFRHKDKPTDILSFPFYPNLQPGQRIKAQDEEEKNLGDLILSAEFIKKDSPNFKQTFEQRLQYLIVHGICHLLGYDHIEDADYRKMRTKELFLLKKLSPNFY